MKSKAGSPNRVHNLLFGDFFARKCLGDRKSITKRKKYEHREGNNRPPPTFPKERGGEKAYSARRGFRGVVWYVFPETRIFGVWPNNNCLTILL